VSAARELPPRMRCGPDGARLIFTYVHEGDWSRPTYALIRADGTHLTVARTSIPITHPRLRPQP
jgi:hypothetical protein